MCMHTHTHTLYTYTYTHARMQAHACASARIHEFGLHACVLALPPASPHAPLTCPAHSLARSLACLLVGLSVCPPARLCTPCVVANLRLPCMLACLASLPAIHACFACSAQPALYACLTFPCTLYSHHTQPNFLGPDMQAIQPEPNFLGTLAFYVYCFYFRFKHIHFPSFQKSSTW